MSITFKQFEIIKAIVTTKSISNAARLVGLSQPTLSQQLAKLEKTLDAQLITRGRNVEFQLTPAGEYWYRVAVEMLGRRADAEAYHLENFGTSGVDIRFSAPSALRFWFFGPAARIAAEEKLISGFEFIWSRSSEQILERMSGRHLNCAAVNAAKLSPENPELRATPVFRDQVVWLVPDSIPHEVVVEALETGEAPLNPEYAALKRYVDLGAGALWGDHRRNWYSSFLPFALPFFRCQEHESVACLVAQGLATGHAPLSLVLNHAAEIRDRARVYAMRDMELETAFVVPRHYLSVPAFVNFQTRLCDAVSEAFRERMENTDPDRLRIAPDPSAHIDKGPVSIAI